MSEKLKFDCGNRNEDCDNATICPCLLFINKQIDNYKNVLQSDIFREATKEERMSVDNYIKKHSVDTGINFNDLIDTE